MESVFYKILDYSTVFGIALCLGFFVYILNMFDSKKSFPVKTFELAFVLFTCVIGLFAIYNPENKVGVYTISPRLFFDDILITYKEKEKVSIIDSKGVLSNQEYDQIKRQSVQCPFGKKTMCLKVLSQMNEQNLNVVVKNNNYQINLDKITSN